MVNKKITTEVPSHNRESGGCDWLTYEVQGESQWRLIGVSVQVFVCLILLLCFVLFWNPSVACQCVPNFSASRLGSRLTWKWCNLQGHKRNTSDVSGFSLS